MGIATNDMASCSTEQAKENNSMWQVLVEGIILSFSSPRSFENFKQRVKSADDIMKLVRCVFSS